MHNKTYKDLNATRLLEQKIKRFESELDDIDPITDISPIKCLLGAAMLLLLMVFGVAAVFIGLIL